MSSNKYETSPEQTAIAIGYKNKSLIADEVMPRVPVGKKSFEFNEFDKTEGFTVPDTTVGRKSEPNQLSFGSKKVAAKCRDRGLTDIIPTDDESDAAGDNLPGQVNRTTEKLTSIIHLDREVRVAAKVFDKANYDESVTVTPAKRFDTAAYNPIPEMLEYLDTPIMRPNALVFGNASWRAFRTNPSVVKAAHGNDGDAGAASRQAVMELFEVEKLLVGQAFVNIAKPGKAGVMARTWGKHCAMLHLGEMFDGEDEIMTWGFTAQYKDFVSGNRDLPGIGLRGGTQVRVGETVEEVIAAKGAGFFLENVVT